MKTPSNKWPRSLVWVRLLPALCLTTMISCSLLGQGYTISTFAGGALPVGIPGPSASFGLVRGVAVDSGGNVFFTSNDAVFRLDAKTGLVGPFAGTGIPGFSGDNGPATSAELNLPWGVAVDSSGNVYIADYFNYRIRKVSNGVITTVAGNGSQGAGGDNGPALGAQLNTPLGVAIDSAGDLYIADGRLRKVSKGVITSLQSPAPSFSATGVAVDSAGDLYIASPLYDAAVWKFSNGAFSVFAGVLLHPGSVFPSSPPGPATGAPLNQPYGVAVDAAGNVYIADTGNNAIRKVSSDVLTTVAGGGSALTGDNGPATSAQLNFPYGVAVDTAGNLYITESVGRIRKVSNGVIVTSAGGGSSEGDNGPATGAQLVPEGVAVDSAGNVYIADFINNRIREVSSGTITTVAGNGISGSSGDNGPATGAELFGPRGVAVDSKGNLYIGDWGNNRVRKVSNGVITTIAGSGMAGFSGDNGLAISAALNGPSGVAVDSTGNLYIADTGNGRIREVSNGVITTVAVGGAVAVDTGGNLFIAQGNLVQQVSNGVVTTVAGNPLGSSSANNGLATDTVLQGPVALAFDSAGNLYITESYGRVRKVSGGMITTIAGGGSVFGDDGPATNAELYQPLGIAVDSAGEVFIADTGNGRVRVLTPSGSVSPPLSIYITSLKNAASNLGGPIAPGEIVVLTGSGLGPARLVSASIGSDGVYDSQLAGTTVTFGGIPAPMIYTSATQVAAIVPYEVTGSGAPVSVTYQGQTSTPVNVAVAPAAPGLFTQDSTGMGQAAAVNQDGSLNGPGAPAKIGDIISLFATGEGQTIPPGVDGKPAALPFPNPIAALTVVMDQIPLQPLYAGGAPGEVAGLLQINVRIPLGVIHSSVPVQIQIGGMTSQIGVTVAVAP